MSAANIEMLERAAVALGELVDDEVVFVGGATVGLWATDEATAEFRPTDDVDVIVEVATRNDYYRFEERLRALGFANDDEDGVICRFRHGAQRLVLDAMPTDAAILGFENRWQNEAFPHAVTVSLPSGQTIRAVPPAYLLATKLEAFRSRGKGDLLWSRDFEDVITLVDRRVELIDEVRGAGDELRAYISAELGVLLDRGDFDSAAEGALSGGPETQARFAAVVRPRVEAIVAAGPA
ncbi:MAG TPA: nucleotidyl transferase AbiEii/AbiGii toxin family protein [Solirubrobacterales bacterium]|nr:nucleotidyl transferase AbiEii/AbiGii toxin family protein [Solirubrobacterales bacterium]